jgi:hypothetical protein
VEAWNPVRSFRAWPVESQWGSGLAASCWAAVGLLAQIVVPLAVVLPPRPIRCLLLRRPSAPLPVLLMSFRP